MAALDFPSSPTDGQVYNNYVWSASKGAWQANPVTSEVAVISPTAPSNPKAGDIWYNSDDGCTYVYYYDGDSSQWVASKNDATFSSTLGPRVDALEAGSSNFLINGGMEIWQRGTSSTASSGTSFVADRWNHFRASGTAGITVSRQNAGLTGFDYCSRIQRDSGNTSTAAFYFIQNLETQTCTPLEGKVVTFSFYARAGVNYSAASSVLRATIETRNGSETSYWSNGDGVGTTIQATTNAVLTTTWQRFTVTATVPSDATQVFPALKFVPVGTAGASDYFEVTGLQLNVGATATAFRRNANSLQGELAACQRYYQLMPLSTPMFGYNTASGALYIPITFPVYMRTAPTVSATFTGSSGSSNAVMNVTTQGFILSMAATVGGVFYTTYAANNTASAEL